MCFFDAPPPEAPATDAFPTLQGPYFGETPPGAGPQIFLPGIVSTTDFDGCVACLLDGRLCVFASATRGTRFSYERDGRWTSPINGGQMFNSFGQPIRMNVTPDGQYLFFPSAHETDRPKGEPIESPVARRWGDWDAYWVSTGFLDELESQVMTRRSAAEVIIREYRTQGLQAAVAKMETLLGEPSDSHYLELSELLVFCGELIGAGRLEEADELSVLRFITEEFPGSGGAWLDLARAYERRGEIESSRAACAEALELDPDGAEAAALLERLVRRKPAG